MIRIFTLLMILVPIFGFGQTTDLFFSEYGEGHSSNKYYEIYNGTGADVDLSEYSVVLYTNGNSTAQSTLLLVGTLANNATYVVANTVADITIKDMSDTLHATCGFNGDDALELRKNGLIIDVFGEVGVDPGTSWTIAGDNTAGVDKVLTRKASVCSPTEDWAVSFGTDAADSQWEINPLAFNATNMAAVIVGIGSHTANCAGNPCTTNPVVSAGADKSVCAGTEVTLSGSGALTYVWDNGVTDNVGFIPTATGTYTVIGTDVNGCIGTDTVEVTVNSLPVVTVSANELTLTASLTGADYQWINCANSSNIAGATAQTYTATANGSYKVQVTDANGCVASSACQAISTVGIADVSAMNTFSLSPNPTKGKVTFNVSGNETASMVIFNALGKEVSRVASIQNGSVIDFSGFNNGVYMVQLTNTKGTKVQRVVKN